MSNGNRHFIVPEVVQTSAMDCGPAALKSLFEGFRIPVSYGRLREACQTELDGTSIDTMEEVASQLGLDAEQIMLPVDHVLLPEARALPAIAVVLLPNRGTHFVLVWRRHGPYLQIMDPAMGRQWVPARRFLDELYVHRMAVPAEDWRAWVATEEFLRPLRHRLASLSIRGDRSAKLIDEALSDTGWGSMAALDAATRMVTAMTLRGGIRGSSQTSALVETFFESARYQGPSGGEGTTVIPDTFWSVRPSRGGEVSNGTLALRGAVLVRARGRRRKEARASTSRKSDEAESLSPELAAALSERPSQPGRKLLGLFRADGLFAPALLLTALGVAAAGVVVEALLFRGLFELGRDLGLSGQRLAAMAAVVMFSMALLFLDVPIHSGVLRMGRRLEGRLRIAFLKKIPRLNDHYFRSRLSSDMAERSHTVRHLRRVPTLGGDILRRAFEILLTTLGIIWLDPSSAPIAILAGVSAVAIPLLAQPFLAERDLRLRTHTGALGRFYLDSLLGMIPVRTHGAERAVRREHESLLVEWARAGLGLQRAVVAFEAIHATLGFGLAAWLLLRHVSMIDQAGMVLLLVYWALNLPVLGRELAMLAWQYPSHRNMMLRLLEPLGAPEAGEVDEHATTPPSPSSAGEGVSVEMKRVDVRASGHVLLENVDLAIDAGAHVAIVGPSGAGKSTLVGLLLGWHRPATGHLRVDGVDLVPARLVALRRQTAWVDPGVQLWNRPLLDNLTYGVPEESVSSLSFVIDQADLRGVLEKLPDGLQTSLGEGGALVSGGQGQRVRLGRALLRPGARLVILDEPFRGLDRESRRRLLERARRVWKDATLFCITHDIVETLDFDRTIVLEHGHVVETGSPRDLASDGHSRFRRLLEADRSLRQRTWSTGGWRRLVLSEGRLAEVPMGKDGV